MLRRTWLPPRGRRTTPHPRPEVVPLEHGAGVPKSPSDTADRPVYAGLSNGGAQAGPFWQTRGAGLFTGGAARSLSALVLRRWGEEEASARPPPATRIITALVKTRRGAQARSPPASFSSLLGIPGLIEYLVQMLGAGCRQHAGIKGPPHTEPGLIPLPASPAPCGADEGAPGGQEREEGGGWRE